MSASSTDEEAKLIVAIARGDRASRGVYADLLEARGEMARAMFLRFDPAELDAEWLAAIGWVVVGQFLFRLSAEARQARTMPVGFSTVQFTATSGEVLEAVAQPRSTGPLIAVRLISAANRRGPTAGGRIVLESLTVGLTQTLGAPVDIGLLSPDQGGVGLTGIRADPGMELRALLRCSHPVQGDDAIHVSLCMFMQDADAPPPPRPPAHLDFGVEPYPDWDDDPDEDDDDDDVPA